MNKVDVTQDNSCYATAHRELEQKLKELNITLRRVNNYSDYPILKEESRGSFTGGLTQSISLEGILNNSSEYLESRTVSKVYVVEDIDGNVIGVTSSCENGLTLAKQDLLGSMDEDNAEFLDYLGDYVIKEVKHYTDEAHRFS